MSKYLKVDDVIDIATEYVSDFDEASPEPAELRDMLDEFENHDSRSVIPFDMQDDTWKPFRDGSLPSDDQRIIVGNRKTGEIWTDRFRNKDNKMSSSYLYGGGKTCSKDCTIDDLVYIPYPENKNV